MEFKPYDITAFKDLLDISNNILVLSHRRPDGDAIGANLALRIALERIGKKVISASIDPINLEYFFMPGVYLFVQDFGKPEDYDLIITVDCGDSYMTDYHKKFPNIWRCGVPVVNIDHHKTNDHFGTINFVKTDAASATHILFFFFQALKWKITYDMAHLLMIGLSFDTGHFKHDNTTPEVLYVASKLMEKGARVDSLSKNLYKNISVPTLKVWGKALSRIKMNDLKIVSTMMTIEDVESSGANIDELKGAELVTYITGVPDSKFSLLLSEKEGLVKGSLRTQNDDVDVSEIASKFFNGGGHKKAAGFAVSGKIRVSDVERKIVDTLGKE